MAKSSPRDPIVNAQLWQLEGVASRLGLLDFGEVSKLGTMEEKRQQMLGRVQEIFEGAKHKCTRSKYAGIGMKPDPDWHTMLRCVQLACELMGLQADAARQVAKPDEEERKKVDIENVVNLLRSIGFEVTKKAA